MQDTFEIKLAQENDIPIIFEFIRQLVEHNNSSNELIATEEILKDSLFIKKYAEVIIGYLNKQAVAYALFLHNFSTLLGRPGIYLVDIYVIPKARNQGIGRNMFIYLATLAKERKCGRLEWSVLKSNKEAISLYENIGAKAMDEWKTYRIEGNILNRLA